MDMPSFSEDQEVLGSFAKSKEKGVEEPASYLPIYIDYKKIKIKMWGWSMRCSNLCYFQVTEVCENCRNRFVILQSCEHRLV